MLRSKEILNGCECSVFGPGEAEKCLVLTVDPVGPVRDSGHGDGIAAADAFFFPVLLEQQDGGVRKQTVGGEQQGFSLCLYILQGSGFLQREACLLYTSDAADEL